MFGPAIQSRLLAICVDLEAELGGDDYVLTERRQSLAHKFFVCVGAVNLGRVKERDTAFHGCTNHRYPLLLLHRRTEAKAQSHATKPDLRYFQTGFAKFPFLHRFSLPERSLRVLHMEAATGAEPL